QIAALERTLATRAAGNDGGLARVGADIARLREAQAVIAQEIRRRFPAYAELVAPQPLDATRARRHLRADEALIATRAAQDRLYVWALRKEGPLAFAAVDLGRQELTRQIETLRAGVTPKGDKLGDIPPFDLALAHRLYREILAPVEAGWKGARKVMVAPDGPLGSLPLAMLVTREAPMPRDSDFAFSGYRSVPWLIREVGITQLPSVASLAVLDAVPRAGAVRKPFIGFGNPRFAPGAPPPQSTQIAFRAVRVTPKLESIDAGDERPRSVAALAPLADTAAELRAIAATLGADPAADVFLDEAANERRVRDMRLDDRRVVAFATHGLVPGDIAGLAEPALALSPGESGGQGDGLLTMTEIAGLKLDADWVVLSACNTAAAGGAGGEAVSGLGRAFFYAGARAVLVSHWPVESSSATRLTTTLFRRLAADATLGRSRALRGALLELIESGAHADPASGRPLYSYAHPIFWAPFVLVGHGRGGADG
ncbi:MAG: CHAT domain-containing protein, partial [Alphaproteobacteria bacterium]|nr:CHAT domain-containing protein [Alphaproteobacteria bacterium]